MNFTSRLVFTILTCVFFSLNLSAQLTIKGKLINHREDPIYSANVFIIAAVDSAKIVAAMSTDVNGDFSFSLEKGHYQIQISYLNKSLFKQAIDLKSDKNLGIIKISKDKETNILEEVLIREKKTVIRLENGKLIFTPKTVSAGSLIDILKIAPTLRAVENSIEIIGKGATEIMINGKRTRMGGQQLMSYLKTIAASEIEKIEIVHESTSEFDAKLKNGYVNVVLKKLVDTGISGSIYVDYAQSKFPSESIGGHVNYSTKKWRIWSRLSPSLSKYWVSSTNSYYFENNSWKDVNEKILNLKGINTSGGVEYNINQRNIIELSYSYDLNSQRNIEESISSIFSKQELLDSSKRTHSLNPQTFNTFSYNVNYVHKFDTLNRKLTLDFDQIISNSRRKQDFSNFATQLQGTEELKNRFLSGNKQNMQITTANLAVEIPTRMINLAFGAKLTFISNDNNTSFYNYLSDNWVPDGDRLDDFNYQENILAAFLRGTKNIGKWSLAFGIRGENTRTEGLSKIYELSSKNAYFKLFPSASIGYQKNEDNTFNLAYGKSITRPGFSWVNPFKWYTNAYEFSHGNPSLQAYFTNSLTLMYVLKQKWNFTMNYTSNENVYAEVMKYDTETNRRETFVENIIDITGYGLNFNTELAFSKKWSSYPAAYFGYQNIISKWQGIEDVKNITARFSVFNQIQLIEKQKLLLNLTSTYDSPQSSGINKYKAMFTQDFGVTLQTFKNLLQFSLEGSDIFKTGTRRFSSNINGIKSERTRYSDSQKITLTVRYRFKKGNTKSKRNLEKTNQEELNRTY